MLSTLMFYLFVLGGFRIRLGARGPPNYQIAQDQLQLLLDRGFTVKRIAEDGLLGSKMHKLDTFQFRFACKKCISLQPVAIMP
ncbi:hypothetical protein DPMN_110123 [Dreissena polymorpha]|uniref:Uncharacterized protein n=1 Tax=Dreissena polymorpha TaxID=45954 RepID=A0A9D4KC03_DREPO|nr:hypothetical protein DPMN_110123 [Dreissena polymorpha]